MSTKLHGADAIAKARELLGRELSASESHIANLEGYDSEVYEDTKGVKTTGFGQTGEYSSMPFDQVVRSFENTARRIVPSYDQLPQALQLRLLDSTYRGGLSGSTKTLGHINAGRWDEAADEFLDNDDFRNSIAAKTGVAGRMQQTSDAMRNYGLELATVPEQVQQVPQQAQEAPPQADAGFLAPVDDFINDLFGGDKSGKPRKEVTEKIPKAHKDTAKSLWDTIFGD
jgi:hypothetical protein